jgi:hypothetical protein
MFADFYTINWACAAARMKNLQSFAHDDIKGGPLWLMQCYD